MLQIFSTKRNNYKLTKVVMGKGPLWRFKTLITPSRHVCPSIWTVTQYRQQTTQTITKWSCTRPMYDASLSLLEKHSAHRMTAAMETARELIEMYMHCHQPVQSYASNRSTLAQTPILRFAVRGSIVQQVVQRQIRSSGVLSIIIRCLWTSQIK